MEEDKEHMEWHGIPRENIRWWPTVDEKKCVGCGMCFSGCGRKVYDYDYKKIKSVVARPLNCMVGCTTCQVTCLAGAISFPDKEYVRELIRKNNLVKKTREQLIENGGSKNGKNK
jgi:NAD-dependent dihydropyrimidine dehydrogenase PreA subunit